MDASLDPFIGIDLGSRRIKAILIDGDKIYSSSVDAKYIDKGLIDGSDYVSKALGLIKEFLSRIDGDRVSIGLTGQRASIIGWGDGWHTDIYTWRHESGYNVLLEVRGKYELGPLEAFLQPGSGILRIYYLKNLFGDRVKNIGGVESYIIYRLFKENIVDYGYAYPYGCLDPFTLGWIDELISLFKIDPDELPSLTESIGELVEGRAWGRRIVLRCLLPDQSSTLIGEGCMAGNMGKISLGTGCFIDVYTGEEFIGDPYRGVNPMLMGVFNGGRLYMAEYFIYHSGDALEWARGLRDIQYLPLQDIDFSRLPLFIPSYRFLATGINKVFDGAYLTRIDTDTEPEALTLSIYASIPYLILRGLGVMGGLGLDPDLFIDGGWSNDSLLVRLIASMTGRRLRFRRDRVNTALYGLYALTVVDEVGEAPTIIDNLNPVYGEVTPMDLVGLDDYVRGMDSLLESVIE